MRGDKVGIIGPNGSGKTTLLRLLLGQLAAAARGRSATGPTSRSPTSTSSRPRSTRRRPSSRTSATTRRSSINGQPRHVLGYLQDFLFPPERSRSLVKFLSGGERSRLLLAKLFTRPSNVLVLDEPTNDLDIETLELLESLLVDYQGTVLLVSHDRAFLNDVVTSTLAIEADGQVKEYDGGYDDYLRQRQAEAPAAPKAATAPAKAAPSREDRPRKLSYKEKQELEALPGRIEELEAASRDLHEAMADPSFYQRTAPRSPGSMPGWRRSRRNWPGLRTLGGARGRWPDRRRPGDASKGSHRSSPHPAGRASPSGRPRDRLERQATPFATISATHHRFTFDHK